MYSILSVLFVVLSLSSANFLGTVTDNANLYASLVELVPQQHRVEMRELFSFSLQTFPGSGNRVARDHTRGVVYFSVSTNDIWRYELDGRSPPKLILNVADPGSSIK